MNVAISHKKYVMLKLTDEKWQEMKVNEKPENWQCERPIQKKGSFPCQDCSKTFQLKHNLNRHIKIHGGPEIKVKCHQCCKELKNLNEHQRHLRSGSCHFNRASNDKFSVQFWIIVIVMFFNHSQVLKLKISKNCLFLTN